MDTGFPPVAIFIAWAVFLAVVITAVMIYRWHRPERYSRFQLKLVLVLLLFLMVPTVPLVFLAGTVVDQFRGLMVALPLDDAMQHGLDTVHRALSEEDRLLDAWREGPGREASRPHRIPAFTAVWERSGGGWGLQEIEPGPSRKTGLADSLKASPPDPGEAQPGIFEEVTYTREERLLFRWADRGVYMALVPRGGAERIEGAGVWVSPELVEAREALGQGLRMFRNITLLGGGRGTQELLWTLASLWLVLLTLGAFSVTRLLARGVSEPVLRLARGMEEVAEGDLDVHLEIRARDEMKTLVDSFNRMTSDLREARERIVEAEKQAAWRDVARRIAHEIKNPLTPLQLGLHRIQKHLQGEEVWHSDPALRESIQTMNEELEALRRMAASFSEYARLPQPEPEPADLEAAVRGAAALFQDTRGVRIQVTVMGNIPPVRMDADLVKRALVNLVKNAVESVEETGGGRVEILLKRTREGLVIEISDEGTGFEAGLASELFRPDYTTKDRGTGLGLSVVSRIVQDHGWEIEAESGGEGGGAAFRIRIPPDEAAERKRQTT
ncbi:MAG: ATP-binding protein [bacterium]